MKYLLSAVILLFCSSAFAKLNIDNAFLLSPNMSKKEVLETMGSKPSASEFSGKLEQWHFCKKTFVGNYEYVSVFFVDSKVVAMKEYGVSVGDARSCKEGIKGGSYREPDAVKEYRVKVRK